MFSRQNTVVIEAECLPVKNKRDDTTSGGDLLFFAPFYKTTTTTMPPSNPTRRQAAAAAAAAAGRRADSPTDSDISIPTQQQGAPNVLDPHAAYRVTEHTVYKAKYSRKFYIPSTANPISIRSLQTSSTITDTNRILNKRDTFIPAVLIRVNYKQKEPTRLYTTFKHGNAKHEKKELKTYRRMFVFASIIDAEQLTFCVIEYSNTNEQLYWSHNPGKNDVSVGDRFCIMEPELLGQLQESQTYIIETPAPFVELTAPTVPPRMIMDIKDGERYFVLKHVPIRLFNLHVVETKCGGTFCDRLQVNEESGLCACYTIDSKTTGSSVTMAFQFDLQVEVQETGDIYTFPKASSLRTTKLFYRSRVIPPSSIEAYLFPPVAKMVDAKTSAVVNHVNANGGWNVIGWAKRGTKYTGTVENTETTASAEIRYHLSYLYPASLAAINSLTPQHLILQDSLTVLGPNVAGNEHLDVGQPGDLM